MRHNVDYYTNMIAGRQQGPKPLVVQDWLPVSDIRNNQIINRDNRCIAILRIMPVNTALMSDVELEHHVDSVADAIRSVNRSHSIMSIGRPVDLSGYINWMHQLLADAQGQRKSLLHEYIQESIRMAAEGDIIERRYYYIVSDSPEKIETTIASSAARLTDAGLDVRRCNNDDLLELCVLYANPTAVKYGKFNNDWRQKND